MKISKKKVLFIINNEVGGGERMSVNISKMLPPEKFDISYVVIKEKRDKDCASSVVAFFPIGSEINTLNCGSHLDKVIKLYKVIKKKNPDVVFASHYNINDKILFLKPFLRKPKFIIRAENGYSTFTDLKKFILRNTYKKADILIAQTDEMRDEFIKEAGLPAEKIITMENPADVAFINKKIEGLDSPFPHDGKKHIVAVGRFHYQKGYDFLIQAFSIILKKEVDAELYIVGSISGNNKLEYNRIMEIANKLGVIEAIHCIGYNDNPFVYVKYADCFVLSSRWEGLPNVVVEALYLKTPVAAFKCIPIIERMVRDGVDGSLAEKDNPEALGEAICKAIKIGRTAPIYHGASAENFVSLFMS